jgi:hypothetical protein
MHVGWSLLVGLIGFRVARRRVVKALFLLHPLFMALTVTATGNHYFLDSVVGALVALSAVAIVAAHLPSRIRARLPRPALLSPALLSPALLRPALSSPAFRSPALRSPALGAPCSSH